MPLVDVYAGDEELIAIQAADIDRSAAFYHAAFGLRIIPTPLQNRRWLDLDNRGQACSDG